MKKQNKINKKYEMKIKIRGYSKKRINNKATARKATKRIPAKHLLL